MKNNNNNKRVVKKGAKSSDAEIRRRSKPLNKVPLSQYKGEELANEILQNVYSGPPTVYHLQDGHGGVKVKNIWLGSKRHEITGPSDIRADILQREWFQTNFDPNVHKIRRTHVLRGNVVILATVPQVGDKLCEEILQFQLEKLADLPEGLNSSPKVESLPFLNEGSKAPGRNIIMHILMLSDARKMKVMRAYHDQYDINWSLLSAEGDSWIEGTLLQIKLSKYFDHKGTWAVPYKASKKGPMKESLLPEVKKKMAFLYANAVEVNKMLNRAWATTRNHGIYAIPIKRGGLEIEKIMSDEGLKKYKEKQGGEEVRRICTSIEAKAQYAEMLERIMASWGKHSESWVDNKDKIDVPKDKGEVQKNSGNNNNA
jgi:hypothetical protein